MRISTGHHGFRVGSQWFEGSQRGSRRIAGVGLAKSTAGMGLAVVLRCFGCGSTGVGLRCVSVFWLFVWVYLVI
jgi:hypothetical protein